MVRYSDMLGLLSSSKAFSCFKLGQLDLSFTRLLECSCVRLPKFSEIKILDLRATSVSNIDPVRR